MFHRDRRLLKASGAVLLVPALHPLLIPLIGLPAHLLWWVHVLPVAMVAFRHGRRGALALVLLSTVLVLAGERVFGYGYGNPASWQTTVSLAVALAATNILVAGFALDAHNAAPRYQLLFDHAASAILRTDAAGRVTAANPATLELFGCGAGEIMGRRFSEIPRLARVPDPVAIPAGGWSGTIAVGCGDLESTAHVLVAAVADEDPVGHQVLIVDRTIEVVQEQEIERQARLAALGEMLAGVAHELNNPLQAITGFAELASDADSEPEAVAEALAVIEEQATRMRGLVQELLGFSRDRRDEPAVDMESLVDRVLRVQQLARGAGVRFAARFTWRGVVHQSPAKLEQILVNLLSNAVDACPPGRAMIEVVVGRAGRDMLIEVADNGPGIDPSLAERIFEPFVTSKGEGVGTGLGLAISRRLAVAMGGTLTVANRPGGGAAFTLRIPHHAGADAPLTEEIRGRLFVGIRG
jgi:two-component system, NtrC family, sensor histidine kinase AtoS